jgi:DNA-binding MarR family transcriptional regulator
VTASGLAALGTVNRHGPLTLGELAAVEGVRPPTMTRIVANLEDAGLLARQPDPADRRVCRVELTAEGRGFVRRTQSRRDAFLAGLLARLEPADAAKVSAAVEVLERLAGETA